MTSKSQESESFNPENVEYIDVEDDLDEEAQPRVREITAGAKAKGRSERLTQEFGSLPVSLHRT